MSEIKSQLPQMLERQLVSELGKILKDNGYLKTGKSWRKEINKNFALKFYVQSSRFEKGDYDVRVGVSVIMPNFKEEVYGDFYTGIVAMNGQQVYEDSIKFFDEWTDIVNLKKKMQILKDWREKNPLEYLRSLPRGEQYEKPPFNVPLNEFALIKYILSDDFV